MAKCHAATVITKSILTVLQLYIISLTYKCHTGEWLSHIQTEQSSAMVQSSQWCPSVVTSNVKCNTTYTAESGLLGHYTMYVYRQLHSNSTLLDCTSKTLNNVTSMQRVGQCCHLASPNLKNGHVFSNNFHVSTCFHSREKKLGDLRTWTHLVLV